MNLYICPKCCSFHSKCMTCSACGTLTIPVDIRFIYDERADDDTPPKPILSLSELADLIVRLRKLFEDSVFWTSDARTALVGVIADLDAKFNAKLQGAKREPEHELPSLTPSELAEIERLARLGAEQYRTGYRNEAIALIDKFGRTIQ